MGDVVQGIGVDSEVKVFKSSAVDIKVYGDWSQLFFPGDSSSADAFAFQHALGRAYDAARHDLLNRVQTRIAHAAPLMTAASTDAPTPPVH